MVIIHISGDLIMVSTSDIKHLYQAVTNDKDV